MEGFGLLIAAYLAAGTIGLVLLFVATARRLSRFDAVPGRRSRRVTRSIVAGWISIACYLFAGLSVAGGGSITASPVAAFACLSFFSALFALAMAARAEGIARIPSGVAAAWLSLIWIPAILAAGASWLASR